jgi:predicted transcriptional regulator
VKRKPFTLRIDDAERLALKNLSEVEGRPINHLLIEAIKSYLSRRSRKERSLEATLEGLRKYRKQNAGFQRAIAAFVDAEASLDDPLEGQPVQGQLVEGRFKPAGPVQSRVKKLLSA